MFSYLTRPVLLLLVCLQGLYYSYYKTMIGADTVADGLHRIMADNVTEFGQTINTLKRFNLYPEVRSASAAGRGHAACVTCCVSDLNNSTASAASECQAKRVKSSEPTLKRYFE